MKPPVGVGQSYEYPGMISDVLAGPGAMGERQNSDMGRGLENRFEGLGKKPLSGPVGRLSDLKTIQAGATGS